MRSWRSAVGKSKIDDLSIFLQVTVSPLAKATRPLKDWSSSDKTLSEGKARRVSAGSKNQFQQFVTPDDGRKFTELYNVQHLQRSQREAVRHRREARRVDSRERINQSAQLDRVSRVCISTIHRLYHMLRSFFFF